MLTWLHNLLSKVRILHLRKNGLKVGTNCYIPRDVLIDRSWCYLITIGNDTTISHNVMIFAHDNSPAVLARVVKRGAVKIGNKCFIGAGAIILPGVHIGDNCIVGAGTVVRHDVPPNSVIYGNPERFKQTTQEFILKHKILNTDKISEEDSSDITLQMIAELHNELEINNK